jgi:Fe(3+) dicitrate transport protein
MPLMNVVTLAMRFVPRCLILVLVACALSSFPFPALAQMPTTGISGRVTDENGAVVSNALVTLRRRQQPVTDAERTATTDARGAFHFADLIPGIYRITASGEGFAVASETVTLETGAIREVSITLGLRQITEEVVVTSSQIVGDTESQQRIPGTVNVLDRQTIETSRVFTFTEALRKIPGINVRDEEGFGLRPNIGIRGLNPTRSTRVLLLEDGIPLTYAPYGDNASYYHPPIDRFDSIEVVKGSGQILYGPTTVGGVINYITPNPPERQAGSVTLVGGTRDYFNGHINYGGTFGRTGILFHFLRKQGEGARENVRTGLNDFNFKSITAIGERQALTTRFNYYGERSQITYSGLTEAEYAANPRGNIFLNDRFDGNRLGASVTHALVFNNNFILTTDLYGSYFSREWWRQSSNSLQRPNDPTCGGIGNLNTTCGNEGRLRDYINFGIAPRFRASSQFLGARNETDFGFRFHYEDQNRVQKNGTQPAARDGSVVEDNERRSAAYSAFIQNRFDFGSISITPGVRLEHIRYSRTNHLLNVTGETNLTQIVPGIGVAYRTIGNTTLFAGVHRGFAPPRVEDVISNTTGASVELDSELSWNYELGFRTAPHRALELEAAFFRMDYENQIIPASLAGGIGTLLTNGGATLHQGAEFAARFDSSALFASPHSLYFRTSYTYLPVVRFEGVRVSSIMDANGARPSITGNRLPYAPEHLLNATIGYAHRGGFNALLEAVRVGSQFSDDRNFDVVPTTIATSLRVSGQLGLIPGNTIWNATVNYNSERLRTTFFITVKNLFDELYIADRSRGILPGTPRLVQGGVTYRF